MLQRINKGLTRILVVAVLATYCGLPKLAIAQATPAQASEPQLTPAPTEVQSSPPSPSAGAPDPSQSPHKAPDAIIDPSAGPLAPVPSSQQQLPNSPSSARQSEGTQSTLQQSDSTQQPVGAAGAQVGATAGGAASKPAGNAIAPAKQRQTRSFLIKLGAVAAAAVAIGTVVALSRGTSGTPPGAR